MSAPEIEPRSPLPETVREVPEEIPRTVEQGIGVKPTPVQPQQVKSNGQVIAQPVPVPASNKPTVSVPAVSQQQLDDYSKGSIVDSKTWFGVYWMRVVKKALQSGFSVIFGSQK